MRTVLHGIVAAALLVTACSSTTAEPATTDVSPTTPTPSVSDDAGAPITVVDASTPPQPGAAIVAEVGRELALLKETHYQHTTHVVEPDGVFDVDCSGWIDYVLGHAAPTALIALPNEHARPLAEDYVSFLAGPPASNSGWTALTTVSDLVPGDIVSWLLPPGATDTGHVMIVRAAPRARDATSFIVPVWDSVAEPHGSTDSRAASGATGIGEGEIVLDVDASGAPVAHEWSDGSTQLTQQIALGRAP